MGWHPPLHTSTGEALQDWLSATAAAARLTVFTAQIGRENVVQTCFLLGPFSAGGG